MTQDTLPSSVPLYQFDRIDETVSVLSKHRLVFANVPVIADSSVFYTTLPSLTPSITPSETVTAGPYSPIPMVFDDRLSVMAISNSSNLDIERTLSLSPLPPLSYLHDAILSAFKDEQGCSSYPGTCTELTKGGFCLCQKNTNIAIETLKCFGFPA